MVGVVGEEEEDVVVEVVGEEEEGDIVVGLVVGRKLAIPFPQSTMSD